MYPQMTMEIMLVLVIFAKMGCSLLHMTASQYKGKYLCGASQKIIRSTGCKKYFFLYTIREMRSTAFQPCITLGGLHWAEMGQKNDFLKKNALKTAFLGDTILDRLASEGAGTPILKKITTFSMLSFNCGP